MVVDIGEKKYSDAADIVASWNERLLPSERMDCNRGITPRDMDGRAVISRKIFDGTT